MPIGVREKTKGRRTFGRPLYSIHEHIGSRTVIQGDHFVIAAAYTVFESGVFKAFSACSRTATITVYPILERSIIDQGMDGQLHVRAQLPYNNRLNCGTCIGHRRAC